MGRKKRYSELVKQFEDLFFYGCEVDSWLPIMVMLPHITLVWKLIPLWLRIIAPPSSGKSAHISLLRLASTTFTVDEFTTKCFVSGFRGKNEDPSQLPQMNAKVVTMTDESTMMDQRKEDRSLMQSILRKSYDGAMTKAFGNIKKKVTHKALFNMLIASTPAVDHYYQYNIALGERFTNYRMQLPDARSIAKKAISNQRRGFRKRYKLLAKSFRDYLKECQSVKFNEIEVSREHTSRIIECASFISLIRTHVPRDVSGRFITSIPQPEIGSRLAQQLMQVLVASTVATGDKKPKKLHMRIATYIGLCSIPSRITAILYEIIKIHEEKDWFSVKDLVQPSRLSQNNVRAIVEDLTIHGILEIRFGKSQGGKLVEYKLSKAARRSIDKIDLLRDYITQVGGHSHLPRRDRRS